MTAHELVAKTRNLPPVSQAALKLVGLLDRADAGNEQIVDALKHDSVLTARLLRSCNAPSMGLEEPVASVDQAVLILGHATIHQIAMTLAFGGAMAVETPGYALQAGELWRHSLIAASAGEILAAEGVELSDPATAFTVGLLHDIGKLALGQYLSPELRAAIRGRMAEGRSSAEAEKDVFGTDHAEVGACLLYLWHLPEEIVEGVANHHRPVIAPNPRVSALCHAIDCLAHLAETSPETPSLVPTESQPVFAALGVSAEKMEPLVGLVRNSFEKVDQFLHLA